MRYEPDEEFRKHLNQQGVRGKRFKLNPKKHAETLARFREWHPEETEAQLEQRVAHKLIWDARRKHNAKWYLKWLAIGAALFLLILAGSSRAEAQVDCVKWQASDSSTVGNFCAPFKVKAGNNTTFTKSGSTITIDAATGSSANKPYIDVVRDCGAVGNGVTDDGPVIQACLDAHHGAGIFFPQTVAHNCSYFSAQTLYLNSSGTEIIGETGGQYLDDVTPGHLGGTEICFPTGVTGFWVDIQSPRSVQSWAIRNIAVRGTAGFTSLITPTGINVPSTLPQYNHAITSIQRSGNVLTVATAPVTSEEGLTQRVGSTVKISGVVGDVTMNGRCIVTALTTSGGSTDNPWGFTCAQNGSDAGPFANDGSLTPPTTGTSTADGIRVCANFGTVDHVGIIRFERHGINADSVPGDGCNLPFSDDLVIRESMFLENGGNGYFCKGVDCNAGYISGSAFYYNYLYGVEDQSSIGNTWIGNNISNNGSQWATTAIPATKAISTISRSLTSGVSTVSVVLSVADANLKLGSCVLIAGVTDSSFNSTAGQCYFLTSYTDSKHFQYEQPGAPADASSSGGTSRMGTFAETYLSSGLDSGGLKIATQSLNWSTALYSNYLEGGQTCKYGPTVLVMPGATQLDCAANDVWKGLWVTTNGSNPRPSTNIANFTNDTDNNFVMQLKAGRTADQNIYLNWLNHSAATQWQIFETPTQWAVYRGSGPLKLELKDTTTKLNGGTTALEINNDSTAAGLVKFFSGASGPSQVGSIDATGKGTFNGGLVINNIAAPTVSANQISFGSTTASTVGAAGAASALPANPTGYIIVNIAGTNFKIPYYAN